MEQPTPSTDLFDLHIDQQVTSYLGETAKWAKFLAVLRSIRLENGSWRRIRAPERSSSFASMRAAS